MQPFDGGGESLANYAQEVGLRRRVASLDPATCASALILHMGSVARDVCVSAGGDVVRSQGGAKKIAELLHE